MENRFKIIQLRCSMFISQFLGFEAVMAQNLNEKLCKEAKIKSLNVPGTGPYPEGGTLQPGLPWSLVKEESDKQYYINFLPNRVDVLMNTEVGLCKDVEQDFIRKSVEWMHILASHFQVNTVFRLAFAPTYSYEKQDFPTFWNRLVRVPSFEGVDKQDLNIQFLYKYPIRVGDNDLQLNLLHNVYDGVKTMSNPKSQIPISEPVIMVGFDLNTVPQADCKISVNDLEEFFSNVLSLKDKLLNNLSNE